MKNLVILFLLFTFGGSYNYTFLKTKKLPASDNYSLLREGDIIFQVSLSGQGKAIQLATKSKYTHVGMIFRKEEKWMVIEAVQPVKWTPLDKFISHGQSNYFVVKRLKDRENLLDDGEINKMKTMADKFSGINYDIYFDWSDEELYCSELVWKLYDRAAGIQVGELQKMKEFDLSSEEVKKKLKERFGDKVPLESDVISPVSIFNSELLETVEM